MNLSTEKTPLGKQASLDAAPARKFMFDRSFDNAADIHRAPERKPVLLKPDQVDAMKKESFDAGFEAGKTAGHDEQTAELTAVLAKVDQNVTRLVQSLALLAQEQEEQTRQLAMAVAKKILPTYAEQNGLQEIEALVKDTIREMSSEPRLVIRVSADEFDALDAKIQEIATQRAYPGKVVVVSEAAVATGDCRIEWADGGVSRDTAETWTAIENTILPS